MPWEDEKYVFIAAARKRSKGPAARVLAPVQANGGTIRTKLCRSEGDVSEALLSRRDGAAFKAARGLDWGGAVWEKSCPSE